MTKDKKEEKKSSGGKIIIMGLLAVIALLAMACGFFYANDRSKKDVGDIDNSKEKQEISLLDESIEAGRLLDNILLQKNNWQLIENEHGEKEVKVEDSGSTVKINQRELAVGLPTSTSLTGAGEWLKEKVEDAGLVYISGKMTKYKKWDAYQAEVGIKVKAGKGSKSFKTDTVIFFHNSNLKKKDKDVKNLPDEKVEDETAPARQFKGRIAIIIDDCGYDLNAVRTLLDTGLPFSYAILPGKTYSSDTLALVKSRGRTAMLHLPMEPMDASSMSNTEATIRVGDSEAQKRAVVRKALASLPGVSGVNNHQGSRATADSATMRAVLTELGQQGMFFVDSRTNSSSVAGKTARQMGVATASNDIFLDNSADQAAIRKQIYKAFAMAERNGSAIAICHARSATAACWHKYASEFKKSGITFVPVTSLLY